MVYMDIFTARRLSLAIHPSRWGRLLSKDEVRYIRELTPSELSQLLDILNSQDPDALAQSPFAHLCRSV